MPIIYIYITCINIIYIITYDITNVPPSSCCCLLPLVLFVNGVLGAGLDASSQIYQVLFNLMGPHERPLPHSEGIPPQLGAI